MTSLIRDFLLEAVEDLRVPNNPSEVSETPVGAPMDDTNFAPAPPPQMPGQGLQMPSIPSMPTPEQLGTSTMQKDVIKKDLVLAITGELKAIIATCEKQFEKTDMTLETSTIYISNLLISLASSAEKLKKMSGMTSEEAPEKSPIEEPTVPETPQPSETTEPMEAVSPEQAPQQSEFTEPLTPGPAAELTSPTEVI